MTFPTGTVISTVNVASADSDPSLARSDIFDLITVVNQLIASVNLANGVATLDNSAKISSVYLPGTISAVGDQTISPTSGVVNLRNVLRLRQIQYQQLGSLTGTELPTAGDLAYITDGDAGLPCLAVNDGTRWRIIRLAATVGDSGAGLESQFVLLGEAD
jgi:carbon starvation protein CstA